MRQELKEQGGGEDEVVDQGGDLEREHVRSAIGSPCVLQRDISWCAGAGIWLWAYDGVFLISTRGVPLWEFVVCRSRAGGPSLAI